MSHAALARSGRATSGVMGIPLEAPQGGRMSSLFETFLAVLAIVAVVAVS